MLSALRILASIVTFVGLGASVVPLDNARPSPSPGAKIAARHVAPQADSCIPADQCCKVCSKGKACGNSCIRQSYTCHKGRGCACNADEVCE